MVDPVLGDAGKLYAGFTDDFVRKMTSLCSKADFILPNMTEASFMLGIPYVEEYDEKYVRNVLRKLAELGCTVPVLTGVSFGDGKQGAIVFTGAVVLGKALPQALEIAVKFTHDCIEATVPHLDEMWYGSCFELCLGKLIEYIK